MSKNFLTDEERNTITTAVANAEKTSSGEIRVVVVSNSQKFESVHAHAVEAFNKYGLQDTKDKTGILIFLSVEEKRIEILADSGINAKVEQKVWDNMVLNLVDNIRGDHACDGICQLVGEIGAILAVHFPIQQEDKDELPNEIVVEE